MKPTNRIIEQKLFAFKRKYYSTVDSTPSKISSCPPPPITFDDACHVTAKEAYLILRRWSRWNLYTVADYNTPWAKVIYLKFWIFQNPNIRLSTHISIWFATTVTELVNLHDGIDYYRYQNSLHIFFYSNFYSLLRIVEQLSLFILNTRKLRMSILVMITSDAIT